MMSERNNDRCGRFRNRFIGLRASDEEAALIAHMAQISGMCKQDYILSRALERTMVVRTQHEGGKGPQEAPGGALR